MTGPVNDTGTETGARAGAAGHPVTSSPCHPVIGLVGGIGSGKSQVAALLAERGARVVSGDELAHEALRRPEVREQVVARWGAQLLDPDGQINRKRLAAIVFADPAELKALEALVHPRVRQSIHEAVERARRDPEVSLVVVDAAILLEAGWHDLCDRLVYVDAPPEVRRARVTGKRGWSAEDLQRRESAQLALTEKRVRADHVVENS